MTLIVVSYPLYEDCSSDVVLGRLLDRGRYIATLPHALLFALHGFPGLRAPEIADRDCTCVQ